MFLPQFFVVYTFSGFSADLGSMPDPPAEAGGGAHQFVRAVYCTFAVTDAFAFNVSVQILALLPPLEHAPLQIASRPLITLSVTAVPGANCADPVLPVATLRPAGFERMRSPLRPPAVPRRTPGRPPACRPG